MRDANQFERSCDTLWGLVDFKIQRRITVLYVNSCSDQATFH